MKSNPNSPAKHSETPTTTLYNTREGKNLSGEERDGYFSV